MDDQKGDRQRSRHCRGAIKMPFWAWMVVFGCVWKELSYGDSHWCSGSSKHFVGTDGQQKGTIGKFAAKSGRLIGLNWGTPNLGQASVSTLAQLPFGIFARTLELHYYVGGFYRSKTKRETLQVP
jgi:hypothetical protein